jgi:hypothetical protein
MNNKFTDLKAAYWMHHLNAGSINEVIDCNPDAAGRFFESDDPLALIHLDPDVLRRIINRKWTKN